MRRFQAEVARFEDVEGFTPPSFCMIGDRRLWLSLGGNNEQFAIFESQRGSCFACVPTASAVA